MAKIVLGVNTLTEVESSVYSNHCQFWYRLGRNTTHEFILNHPRRMSIDRMRNVTAKVALDAQADYICFIDDDVLIPIDTIDRLIASDADIAAGWTIIRGYPFKNMFFRWVDDEKLNLSNLDTKDITYNESGDIPVDAVGFSCVLIKVDLLRKIQPPYFVTGAFNTEDIYFCVKAKNACRVCTHDKGDHIEGKCRFCSCPGYIEINPKIVVNPRVITAHNLGAEYIDIDNVAAYKEYFEKIVPDCKAEKVEKPGDVQKNIMESVDFHDGPSLEDIVREAVFETAPTQFQQVNGD